MFSNHRGSAAPIYNPFLASCLRDRAIIDRDPSKELLTPITNALVSERLRAGLTAHRMHDTNGHESKMRKARTCGYETSGLQTAYCKGLVSAHCGQRIAFLEAVITATLENRHVRSIQ